MRAKWPKNDVEVAEVAVHGCHVLRARIPAPRHVAKEVDVRHPRSVQRPEYVNRAQHPTTSANQRAMCTGNTYPGHVTRRA